MRCTKALLVLSCAAAVTLPGLVLVGPAAAATDFATKVLIERSPHLQVYGRPVTVRGAVEADDPTTGDRTGYLPGASVHLQRELAGQTSFRTVADAVTDSTAVATFTTTAQRNATYRVVYDGGSDSSGDTFAAATSTSVLVKVQRAMHSRALRRNGKIYLAGNVDPGYGHHTVFMARKRCASCSWVRYTSQRTTATGGYRFRTPAPRHGSWYWRAYIPAGAGFVKSLSSTLRTYRTYN